MVYNKADTTYWKAAQRIKNTSETIFTDLEKELQRLNMRIPVQLNGSPEPSPHDTHPVNGVGDLEPPMDLLQMLISQDIIPDDVHGDLLLDMLPIDALLSYEIGKPKPVEPVPVAEPVLPEIVSSPPSVPLPAHPSSSPRPILPPPQSPPSLPVPIAEPEPEPEVQPEPEALPEPEPVDSSCSLYGVPDLATDDTGDSGL